MLGAHVWKRPRDGKAPEKRVRIHRARAGGRRRRRRRGRGRVARAAKAGAAIAHIHVREPDSGKPSRRVELYREVVSRIRESNVDVIINLTTGMGGDLFLGPDEEPMNFSDNTDCVGIMERIKHVEELLPEICSLDCGSFNYAEGDYVYISTPNMLEQGARRLQEIGVKPELEVFELGHISFTKYLMAQ